MSSPLWLTLTIPSIIVTKEIHELHPRGTFPAQVNAVEENEANQYGPNLTIKYTTQHKLETGENAELWERCSIKFSSMSKLGNRIINIMNYPNFDSIPIEFETEDMVGQLCTVIVEHVKKDERTYANIVSAVPFEKQDSGNGKPSPPPPRPTLETPKTIDDIPF